jgi:hypothetical protein
MITTFEVVLKDAAILNKIKWNFMLVRVTQRSISSLIPQVYISEYRKSL